MPIGLKRLHLRRCTASLSYADPQHLQANETHLLASRYSGVIFPQKFSFGSAKVLFDKSLPFEIALGSFS